MERSYDLLVFDWDGTLIDSSGAIVESIQATCADLGLEQPLAERARHIIGLGLPEAIRALLPDLPPARYPELVARYRHHYLLRDHALEMFAGALELLGELSAAGYLLAVATGKSRRGLERAFDHTGARGFFHASRCADESFSKPHPAMLLEILEELGGAPERTLVIGDTTHDLLMARNAGVDALALSHGAHQQAELLGAGPLACLADLHELRAWLAANG